VFWHGDIGREAVLRVLRDLRFVSETYGLVIPASASRRAVADLAILITLWAAASRGVDKMYGLAAREKSNGRAATNGYARGLRAANGRGGRRRHLRRALAARRRLRSR
jgi:hypothetical protein